MTKSRLCIGYRWLEGEDTEV